MSHLFDSLQAAADLVVRQDGFLINDINKERWALTYRCSVSEVDEALKIALNGSNKLPEEVAAACPPSVQIYEGGEK